MTEENGIYNAAGLSQQQAHDVIELLNDPAGSYWFRSALAGALDRDPVDALNDAELLVEILRARLAEDMQG